MSSPQDKFNAAYQRTREAEKELREPNSNPCNVGHECVQIWPSREVGSQQTPNLAYNDTHSHVKRGKHAGGIWASIVRGCAAR